LTESSWLLNFIGIVLVFIFLATLVLYVTYLFLRRVTQGEGENQKLLHMA